MFLELIKKIISKECFHEKITPEMDEGYCPDCGEYIQNVWYLTRCSCCGIKQTTIILKGEISPEQKFCPNCGHSAFTIEKLKKINFVDINYAVVVKQIIKNKKLNFFQSWVEPTDNSPVKLIPAYAKNNQ